jgi:uncharacterized protein YcfJ
MKIIVGLMMSFLSLSSLAISNSFIDYANVVSIEEVYRDHSIARPYQDCYMKEVRKEVRDDGSFTNELIGGVVGGVIGNQFGGGSGNDAMTIAGALLGASIANDGERNFKVFHQKVCQTKYDESTERRFSHYLVSYKFGERVLQHRTTTKPGDRVRIKVSTVVM